MADDSLNSQDPERRAVITGIGCTSPLGIGISSTLQALREARDCISPVTSFDTSGCRSHTAGQILDSDLEQSLNGVRRAHRWHRTSQMLFLAMREALGGAPGFVPDLVSIGTTSGGMSFGEDFYRACLNHSAPRFPKRKVRSYLPHQPILDAACTNGIEAPLRIFSNACASGTNAVGHAFQVIRSGRASRVICGGYDGLAELVFAGFDALQAATDEKCRPFDRNRTGLVLGEGAAVLAVESLASARGHGRQVLAELSGYGEVTDNFHLTQPNPDGSGPRLAMEGALKASRTPAAAIDYINAHGTATTYNDACEGRAIRSLCPNAAVSSTKGQMGHSLGAAGAIEAVICTLAIHHGFLPANINYDEGDVDMDLDIVANNIRPVAPRRVLSNSLGFGGANASLLLTASGE